MKKSENVFLTKISEQLANGVYDKYLTIPFMSKNLVYACIKEKLENKITSGGTPILNDGEIMMCVNEAKETAVETYALFGRVGMFKEGLDGKEISQLAKLSIKETSKVKI